ncbi:5E5 antigen-like [Choloepus didactylus]|uniref:5E5 antigen-like n=1 Tax=Choloepus didactylus TaxID=27675 RepID=UPI00189C73CB|nr:5E5 antigen-like [Choloepus didactylus]
MRKSPGPARRGPCRQVWLARQPIVPRVPDPGSATPSTTTDLNAEGPPETPHRLPKLQALPPRTRGQALGAALRQDRVLGAFRRDPDPGSAARSSRNRRRLWAPATAGAGTGHRTGALRDRAPATLTTGRRGRQKAEGAAAKLRGLPGKWTERAGRRDRGPRLTESEEVAGQTLRAKGERVGSRGRTRRRRCLRPRLGSEPGPRGGRRAVRKASPPSPH